MQRAAHKRRARPKPPPQHRPTNAKQHPPNNTPQTTPPNKQNNQPKQKTPLFVSIKKAPLLPKLRASSPDYREAAAHFSAHDESSPAIALDREKCVKCGRCVEVCQDVQGMDVLGWFARGRERHIGFMCGELEALAQREARVKDRVVMRACVLVGWVGGMCFFARCPLPRLNSTPKTLKFESLQKHPFQNQQRTTDSDMTASACISCGQCVSVCPVGALSEATHWRQVLDLLASKRKVCARVRLNEGVDEWMRMDEGG